MAREFRNRRKNYFIKKKFQRDFILKFCALVVMGAVISGFIIYAMSRATVTTTFENTRLVMKSTADFILPAVLLSGAVVIALIGLATVAVTLFTSHRIAGPLYHLERDVERIIEGDLTIKFGIRKNDELQALPAILNDMTGTLRNMISKMKRSVLEAEAMLEKGAINEAKMRVSELKTTLSKFIT